jgi:hypothetical protein
LRTIIHLLAIAATALFLQSVAALPQSGALYVLIKRHRFQHGHTLAFAKPMLILKLLS